MELYNVAVCTSRTAKKYKNKKMSWQAMTDLCRNTHRTAETQDEYFHWGKDQQSEVKDHGGFVAGYLRDGIRKNSHVQSRSMIALDIDSGEGDTLQAIRKGLQGLTWLMYSTHKHTPEKPRVRIIVPLTRDVSAEEYEAVSRVLADQIGMKYFDPTTFQPARMMFWPTTSHDAEFIFESKEGALLDPEDYKAKLPDWRDVSCWPGPTTEKKVFKEAADPLSKDGIIGAFCWAYGIAEAIATFIPDVYEETDKPDRFTYTSGSTYGGVVVYNNLLMYSNHATDPCGDGHCYNAYDMVRIHKFGKLDEGAKGKTKPSVEAMNKFCMEQPECRRHMDEMRLADMMNDFEGEELDLSWTADLELDSKGRVRQTTDNFRLVMKHDPHLAGLGGLNELSGQKFKSGQLPWTNGDPGMWTDTDDAGLQWYLEKYHQLDHKNKMLAALAMVHEENKFHPVRDYLDTLTWDGELRLDTLLIDYLGADDTPYVRAVTRKAFVAAVKRIREPGCKYDTMLTLVGPQGVGKSYLLQQMGMGWFTDSIYTMTGKEAYEALSGKWIVEVSEMSAARKSEIEAQKQFISKTSDFYRPPYGRNPIDRPRQCVLFGTTNDDAFLNDYTGGRRFWPVKVGENQVTKNLFSGFPVDQIWAEAQYRYQQGESVLLPSELLNEALAMQDAHTEIDEDEALVQRYLDTPLPDKWYTDYDIRDRQMYMENAKNITQGTQRKSVCVRAVWHECFMRTDRSIPRADSRRIGRILRKLGWQSKSKNPDMSGGMPSRVDPLYGSARTFYRP